MKNNRLLLTLLLGAACAPDPAAEYNVTATVKPPTLAGTGGSPLAPDAGDEGAAPDAESVVDDNDVAPLTGGTGGTSGTPGGSAGFSAIGAVEARAPDALRADVTAVLDGPSPPDGRPARDGLASDAIVVAKECSEVYCPALFEVARQCSGHESSCRSAAVSAPGAPVSVTRYCHANGVKKLATSHYSDDTFRTSLQVRAPDGRDCYQLEMTTKPSSPIERWVFRLWSGDVLAHGSWSSQTGKTTLTCEGVTYDVSATDCPGTDGEPSTAECPRGTCN
jgi:hypothetical protein